MTAATLRTALLLAATVTMGLSAGVFDVYSHTIMPGLKNTDDRTFVGAFQAIDRAIINPWFIGGTFLAALILTAGAAATQWGRDPFPWTAVAVVLYLLCVVITFAVNVPLNDAIKAAGNPDTIGDLAAVRQHFHEARWAAFNLVRSVASTAAFVSLGWALIAHGRSTA
jgi:uncharacterized membrane protein